MRKLSNVFRVIIGVPVILAMTCFLWPVCLIFLGYDDANNLISDMWYDYMEAF